MHNVSREAVKTALRESELKDRDLAELCGVGKPCVSMWLRGKRPLATYAVTILGMWLTMTPAQRAQVWDTRISRKRTWTEHTK